MNREIKFRVWDKLAKCFIYPDKGYQGHYVLTLGGEFYNLQNGSGGNEYIVQQYTGLKDKNSKEIYEGDIVKLRFSEETCGKVISKNLYPIVTAKSKTEFIGEVLGDYHIGILSQFCYYIGGVIPFFLLKSLVGINGIEVIGNVFETPDLL